MPQFGFYMAGASVPIVGGPLGLLLAWDPHDRGPAAADEIDWSDISLYSWLGAFSGTAVAKIKSKSPMQVPAENCPITLDGAPDHNFIVRFGVKSGGVSGSAIVDGWLEVFEGNNRVYGIAPVGQTAKIELADGSSGAGAPELSMQDRLVFAGLADPLEGWHNLLGTGTPAIELWRALMTSNTPLTWSPL